MSPVNSGHTDAQSVEWKIYVRIHIPRSWKKKHIAKKAMHPNIDDTKPVKNCDRLIVMEEWVKRETCTQDARLARLLLSIPEAHRPWVAPWLID